MTLRLFSLVFPSIKNIYTCLSIPYLCCQNNHLVSDRGILQLQTDYMNIMGLEHENRVSFPHKIMCHDVSINILRTCTFFFFFGHSTRLAGSQFPHQALNLHPLQWKLTVFTTGLLGKSQEHKLLNGVFHSSKSLVAPTSLSISINKRDAGVSKKAKA